MNGNLTVSYLNVGIRRLRFPYDNSFCLTGSSYGKLRALFNRQVLFDRNGSIVIFFYGIFNGHLCIRTFYDQ